MSVLTIQDEMPTVSIEVDTPDGKMFVNIMENDNGEPIRIHVIIGKAGTSIAAWAQGCSNLMSAMLVEGCGINKLIECLSLQTSGGIARTLQSGEIVRSSPDGIVTALMQYRKVKFSELKGMFEGDGPSVS